LTFWHFTNRIIIIIIIFGATAITLGIGSSLFVYLNQTTEVHVRNRQIEDKKQLDVEKKKHCSA